MTKYRYSNEWIQNLESEFQWMLYYYQQKIMYNRIDLAETVAEIGVGTRFTYNYLKTKGIKIQSIDIDAQKKPDVVLNIVECNPADLKFDVVLAFNIFEHIPYKEFLEVIRKLHTAGVRKIFIGLPRNKKIIFELYLRLGRFWKYNIMITIKKKKITAKNHHWELDYKIYDDSKIIEDIHRIGFKLTDQINFKTNTYFYFQAQD